MIWYFLTFVLGAAIGFGGLAGFAAYVTGRAKPSPNKRSGDLRRKLAQSKKRFGQIANRQSIGEARKIANTALKELNAGGDL